MAEMDDKNVIATANGTIVIQSCDEHEANIGVFVGERSAYHHVALPGFTRRWRLVYSTELTNEKYDQVLLENMERILAVIRDLCKEAL